MIQKNESSIEDTSAMVIKDFSKCLNALALELPSPVWNDVYLKWVELQNAILEDKKKEAVAFGDWVDDNSIPKIEDGGEWKWAYNGYLYTTDQLYNLFKSNQTT